MPENLRVLFLSPEVVPFAKTGGLADVAGSLPKALKNAGIDVRLIMPFYRTMADISDKNKLIIKDVEIPFGSAILKANAFETIMSENIPVYLVEREDMFDRPNLYGNSKGDYYDNLERFSFFSHAALRISQATGFSPDIIHCNDWQTGLVPALLKGPYRTSGVFTNSASVFTIHNMGYQGIFAPEKLTITGLSGPAHFHPDGIEYWGNMSLLKAGIVYSDAVTTVSPTYAEEIMNHEYGLGMEGVLLSRKKSLYGILNGIDYHEWAPQKDGHISANYSLKTLSLKKKCKIDLLSEVSLDLSLEEKPLIGMISRLDKQKGLDILMPVLEDILGLDAGLVILGSGDEDTENALRKTADHYPERITIHTGFNNPLAHRIVAGSDIFLVPSRYEPCGLTQMYALKYGAVPVVRAIGGLNDTIEEWDNRAMTGNGFKFGPYDSSSLLDAVKRAIDLYNNKKLWRKLIANGMKCDFSWERSAERYLEIYRLLAKK